MGALIPLALGIAPEIAKWLFGGSAAKVTQQVGQAVQQVTGTNDAATAEAVLSDKPDLAQELRVQLAQIAAQAEQDAGKAQLDTLTARIKDVTDARAQTVALAQSRSPVAYGAPVVSLVVLVTFGAVMALALTRSLPAGSETILNMLLGTLAAMATSVVSYWVGSSAGSARKDERLAQVASSRR
ncbi:MAG TPA: hypothetical protein VME92_12230 [Acetobacteraceae bacterium]|nr:hypothetical protein [Acetobacteraceae bacterium]